ncbi:hypothetical protein ERT44_16390 [Stenotrophomonas sp. MA5]|uniref:hypothetical protein n=1 Tax=Stenotrophomonas sp. MA5 TaxID=2508572 RepID=UPI001009B80D|nr:hypothetical protein [Stenotrophomonas sp. MA5]RXK64260.1 hypothetical protein ERT44_16390 [Stenotrophomonas sp. MA5]
MELADWVKQAYRLGEVQSALEMNLQLCAKSISALNKVDPRFDEETLTGAMIGAFVGAYPLCAASYPGTQEDALQWRSYGKNDRGRFGESRAGADFAMMILIPNKKPRLAIFQAKSDASKKIKDRLYVGQIKKSKVYPTTPDGKVDKSAGTFTEVHRNQVKALTDTALTIHGLVDPSARLEDLRWVHYLGQFEGGVVAVPISNIAGVVRTSIADVSVEKVFINASNSHPLHEVLLDACGAVPKHWLEIDVDISATMPPPVDLTDLVEMMPVVVGGGTEAMTMTFTIDGVESAALVDVIVSSSPPTPAATAVPSGPKA